MSEFLRFKEMVYNSFGLDLNSYKENQLKRRLDSMLSRKNFSDYQSFFNHLKLEKKAWPEFLDYLTINVSEFFRDVKMFQSLETNIFPELLKTKSNLKIWSAACSNGCEPYTIAIILNEISMGKRHQIDATDLDKTILQAALAGSYTADSVRNIHKDRLSKYFTLDNGKYNVCQQIKGKVTFKQHNLLSDNYPIGYDLIVCRNVTIYFTREAQDKVNSRFAQSLNKGGFLFIGGSETIFNYLDLGFEKVSPCFYRKK
ncbi:CheR family methyltransferase [Desulforamulus aquiferis]|uniref:protein-glutamate O-methyltransferase n=1 Tax=Desulforamulus aquiferis TaxID=1397668 RepID=A0AAW7ZF25_9FIRM|nr:protein-glutamate O-methyltransferase CheR [Desulforamulus aquiferis]MDO7788389.1 protein-glutamate O-methyltransferase CheR [Desulforamulus aquiferis]RYD03105.1 chemotaxis protein CheR [Desulforamulus aquiferis]